MTVHTDFYGWNGPRERVQIGDRVAWTPLLCHDDDVFSAVHTASYEAVRSLMPSDALRPVRRLDGHALVLLAACRYHSVTWAGLDGTSGSFTPHAELVISALVHLAGEHRLPSRQRRWGALVLQMPTTTLEACEHGRVLYGLPRFVADLHFSEDPSSRQVRVYDDGSHILSFTVRPAGPPRIEQAVTTMYSARDGSLLETELLTVGDVQSRHGGACGALILGDPGSHPVSDALHALRISVAPIAVHSYLDHRAVLEGPGRTLGPARALAMYGGSQRVLGEYTVRYPDAAPIDQYALERLTMAAAQDAPAH